MESRPEVSGKSIDENEEILIKVPDNIGRSNTQEHTIPRALDISPFMDGPATRSLSIILSRDGMYSPRASPGP